MDAFGPRFHEIAYLQYRNHHQHRYFENNVLEQQAQPRQSNRRLQKYLDTLFKYQKKRFRERKKKIDVDPIKSNLETLKKLVLQKQGTQVTYIDEPPNTTTAVQI